MYMITLIEKKYNRLCRPILKFVLQCHIWRRRPWRVRHKVFIVLCNQMYQVIVHTAGYMQSKVKKIPSFFAHCETLSPFYFMKNSRGRGELINFI